MAQWANALSEPQCLLGLTGWRPTAAWVLAVDCHTSLCLHSYSKSTQTWKVCFRKLGDHQCVQCCSV